MKAFFCDHQNKSVGLQVALLTVGHEIVGHPDHADVVFADYPVHWHGDRLAILEAAHARGALCLGYQHGGPPTMQYDGIAQPCPTLTADLVHGEGHAELMRRIGYPVPVHVAGWHYCKTRKFKPPDKIRHVLFAPAHPWADGHTNQDYWYDLNRRAYQALEAYECEQKTVRFFGSLAANGIYPQPGITLTRSRLDNIRGQVKQIDQADLVIADGTFAYLAIARGKPTIMVAQNRIVHNDTATLTVNVERWEAYKDYLRWPYDFDDGPFPDTAEAARQGSERADEWKSLFVGEQLDPEDLDDYLQELAATQLGVTA